MNKYPNFKAYAEAREQGQPFTKKDGAIPNVDIPKAPVLPHLLKLDKSLAGRDYKGQMSTNPVKATKDDPLPYKADVEVKNGKELLVNDDDPKTGLAFKGNKVQTPTNSAPLGKAPEMEVKRIKSTGKMTSEDFINQTKDLSPQEFVDFFLEGSDEPLPTITDLYGNEFTPDPNQTIQYMASLMGKNPRLLSRFVREMKRNDGGQLLFEENYNHPEFYDHFAKGMAAPEEGRKRCHRVARAMNEQYMDALGKFTFENNLNEEVQPKKDLAFEDGGPLGGGPQNPSGMTRLVKPKGGPMGGGGPADITSVPAGNGGIGGAPDMPQQGPVPGGPFGGGMGSPPPEAGMPGQGNGPMPPGSAGGIGGGPGPMTPSGGPMTASNGPPGFDAGNGGKPNVGMPKMKGETAHGNMIEEMGGFPHMKAHMSSFCLNGDCKK